MLRRLLVVGLAGAWLVVPSVARSAAAGGGSFSGRTPAASLPAFPALTVAIFYYPWYGTPSADGQWVHWNQNDHRPPGDLYSRFFPARGPYSSSSASVVEQQMSEIAGAGVDEVVVSWWGRGSDEDRRLPLVLSAARRHGLTVAIHLEPYPGRTPDTVAADLAYLATDGVRDVYVYHPDDFTAAEWAAIHPLLPATMRLLAATGKVGFARAAGFAGIYTYDFVNWNGAKFARLCAQAHALRLLCAPSVGPGYDGRRAGEPPVGRPRLNGLTYDGLWAAALAARPDVVSITSFNEWGEGTQIEPARPRAGYRGYEGAWGLHGRAAEYAYLTRTAYWAARFHGLR